MSRWAPNVTFDHVFAVIRVDRFDDQTVPLEDRMVTTKVFWTREAAEAEVDRLNHLRKDQRSTYFCKVGRLERVPRD
jgi:hypothetical protein